MPVVEYTAEKGLVQKSGTTASLDLQGQIFGNRVSVMSVSDAVTLTVADSGKTILATPKGGAAYDITLPKLDSTSDVEGLHFRIILAATGLGAAEDVSIKQNHANDDFVGHIIADDGVTSGANTTRITFDQNTGAVAGDSVECFASDTKWFIRAHAETTAGVKFV